MELNSLSWVNIKTIFNDFLLLHVLSSNYIFSCRNINHSHPHNQIIMGMMAISKHNNHPNGCQVNAVISLILPRLGTMCINTKLYIIASYILIPFAKYILCLLIRMSTLGSFCKCYTYWICLRFPIKVMFAI